MVWREEEGGGVAGLGCVGCCLASHGGILCCVFCEDGVEDGEEGGVWSEGCGRGWDLRCCSYCEGEGWRSGGEEAEDLF